MIVCLCHGITDKQVREAAAFGDCTTGELYKRLGLRPSCASCVPFVCDALRTSRQSFAPDALATGAAE